MSFETVIYEKDAGIARVTLHRPERHNLYNLQMRDDLHEVLQAARDDPEVRAVLFHGSGSGFCKFDPICPPRRSACSRCLHTQFCSMDSMEIFTAPHYETHEEANAL